MEEISQGEKAFIEKWSITRKTWSWGQNFKKTFLYIALPLIFMIDVFNFLAIGDISYAYISFQHFFQLVLNILLYGVLLTFIYNLLYWNRNEVRYKFIMRKHSQKRRKE